MALDEFVNFYKPILNFSEDEWSTFINTMSTKLPSALRITPSPLKEKIKSKLTLPKNPFFEDVYDAVHRGPQDRDLIIHQTDAGFIQRQEVVSMLPVLLMDLQSNHSVLDMCAAPGSKTKQLLEKARLIVANDCNAKRLNILVTETSKIPHKSYMVLKHDASALPVFKSDFDRILCDVPCSGDGTARKNPLILDKWTLQGAIGLSNLQLRILKHSFKFVKDDGLVVYSTCSLNPLENEYIVNKAVQDEDLEIVDLREHLNPNFIVRYGITNLTDHQFNSEEFKSIKNEDHFKFNNEELRKCIRVYPHDNNTGGFFITGLRKKTKSNTINNSNKNSQWREINPSIKDKLDLEYDLTDKIIVHKEGTGTLYDVSSEIFDIISNNRLNVVYCGYKIFEKCNLTLSGYRMKNNSNLKWDIEVGNDAIINKTVRIPFRKGFCLVRLIDFNIVVGGHSYGEKINLNLNNILQKALLDFIEQ